MIRVEGCGVGCVQVEGSFAKKIRKTLKRVGKAAKKAGADTVKVTRKSLPYLAVVANVVPGVGPALSVALGAAAGASEQRKSKKRAAREAEAYAAAEQQAMADSQQQKLQALGSGGSKGVSTPGGGGAVDDIVAGLKSPWGTVGLVGVGVLLLAGVARRK